MVEMYIIKEEMRSLNCSAQVSFSNNDPKERIKSISLNKIFLDTKAKSKFEIVYLSRYCEVEDKLFSQNDSYIKKSWIVCFLFNKKI